MFNFFLIFFTIYFFNEQIIALVKVIRTDNTRELNAT